MSLGIIYILLNRTFSIANFKITVIPPAGSPAIPHDPIAARVVVPHDDYRMVCTVIIRASVDIAVPIASIRRADSHGRSQGADIYKGLFDGCRIRADITGLINVF